jgi:molybdopterin molybdotransferase
MISVNEAKSILKQSSILGKNEQIPLEDSFGRYLAEDIFSPLDIPFFDNSAMDGYAIKWKDGDNSRKLRLFDKIKAGDLKESGIETDEAIRIFTGAPVPKGADTIIPQEWVKVDGEKITFDIGKFEKGANSRSKGAQNKKGDLIAHKGSHISPGMVGLLASIGLAKVPVHSLPSVGIILTGDELLEIGQEMQFGKVYNSNGPVLKTYLQQLGIEEIDMLEAVDDLEILQKTIDGFLNKFDVLILSGGISVGDYDFVKKCLENSGVKQLFYKIRQKPGKPIYVGQKNKQWVFALPGNPASTLTCFNQYVKPCLMAWMGSADSFEPTGIFPLFSEFNKKTGITLFLKAKMSNGQVHILPGQESFNLISYGTANCIAEIEEESDYMEAGTKVKVYSW